jgi:uncharacterized protein (UPF0335 family)
MSNKYQLAEKAALEQRAVVGEIEALVKSIERCEKTISDLKAELEQVLMVGYAYGYFDARDLMRVGLLLTVVESLILLLLVPFYWPLIGIS